MGNPMLYNLLNYPLVSPDWGYYGGIKMAYQGFNLLEGIFWIILSGYVYRRQLPNVTRILTLQYTIAFFCFGLTDFVEVFQMPLWLLLIKGVFLALILITRHKILKLAPGRKF